MATVCPVCDKPLAPEGVSPPKGGGWCECNGVQQWPAESTFKEAQLPFDEYGTYEQREAVTEACRALDELNKKLERCYSFGIWCNLHSPEGRAFVAEFTKTTTILPLGSEE